MIDILRRFIYGGDSGRSSSQPTYPESVRYALAYKAGRLDNIEIQALLEGGYVPEATYLIMKGLGKVKNHSGQSSLLTAALLASRERNNENLLKRLELTLQNNTLKGVDGVKLALISRQGRALWREKYKGIAESLVQGERSPVLIAYSTIFGLDQFLAAQNQGDSVGPPIYVMLPISQHTRDVVGFKIGGDIATKLSPDFRRPMAGTIIDDVIKTGQEMAGFEKFYRRNQDKRLSYGKIIVDTA